MKSDEASKNASLPQLVKFNKAFKLAEQWVNNTSKLEDDKSFKVKVDVRPPRLGVGAAVPRESKVISSIDPVERRLRATLESDKKKVVKNAEESAVNGSSHEDSDDEEPESKTQAFAKKRPADYTLSLQGKKKLK